MEIGPIPGIRAVSPVQSNRAASDLSAVFRAEFQGERQESYTPHRQSAERGLEDEEEDDSALEEDDEMEAEPVRQAAAPRLDSGKINFFA